LEVIKANKSKRRPVNHDRVSSRDSPENITDNKTNQKKIFLREIMEKPQHPVNIFIYSYPFCKRYGINSIYKMIHP
jgi:hypothetical protein